tara:strand:+ start:4830 stop:6080 length:1251 start_codon:yes stop_codon:yes gene_type:complete
MALEPVGTVTAPTISGDAFVKAMTPNEDAPAEPAVVEPAVAEPAVAEPVASEPAAPESKKGEPVATESKKEEPAKTGDPFDELGGDDAPDKKDIPTDEKTDEEKAAEVKAEEDAKAQEVEEGKKPKDKAGVRIEELKTEIKDVWKAKVVERDGEIASRDAEIEALKGSNQEVEELRKFKEDYQNEMSVVKLEKTDAFKSLITAPLDMIETKAMEIAEESGIDQAQLLRAFTATESSERKSILKEALSGLGVSDEDAYELRKMISDTQIIFDKRDELFENSDKALAELSARKGKEDERAAATRREEWGDNTELASKRISDKIPMIRDIVEGVTGSVKDIDLDTLDPVNRSYYAVTGAAFPKVVKKLTELQEENDSLLDEISAFKKASPNFKGGASPTDKTKPKDFGAAMLQGLGHAG